MGQNVLEGSWERDGEWAHFSFPSMVPQGFGFVVNAGPIGINVVISEEIVVSYLPGTASTDELVLEAVDTVLKLISPSARLRVTYAGNTIRSKVAETLQDGSWLEIGSSRRRFFHWFGQVSEEVLVNNAVNHPRPSPDGIDLEG